MTQTLTSRSFSSISRRSWLSVEPSGRFLYVASFDTMRMFRIIQSTGALIQVANTPVVGIRSVEVEPSGRFVYAVRQFADTIGHFAIDQDTGRTTEVGSLASVMPMFMVALGSSQ